MPGWQRVSVQARAAGPARRLPAWPLLASLSAVALLCSCGGGGSQAAAVSGPRIESFSADSLDLQEGQSTVLHASFSGGLGVVDGGVGPVDPGAAIPVTPADNQRYTLTVTAADGQQVQRSVDLRIVQDLAWDFGDTQGWTFRTEPPELASAGASSGALVLWAQAGFGGTAGIVCGEVSASAAFGDSRLRAGRYAQLSLRLDIQAWELGLGLRDTNIPVLSLTYAGQQVSFPVSGFTAMPAVARIEWGAPARLYLGDRQVASAQPSAVAADAEPRIQLSANGCSEGLSQRLVIDQISVTAR